MMEGGYGRQEASVSSHRSSPVARGPSTPTSSSPIVTTRPRNTGHSVLADRYVIGQELGRGAHGKVFKAFDNEDNKFVAVKQISLTGVSKEKLNGIIGEIALLKNLDHTNIVQYFDSVKTNNHLYIILEYMESGSLAGLIKPKSYGAVTENLAAVIVAQILQGLKYLHAEGVVHRDIKGANILTTKDMIIKLADFGVAEKLFDRGTTANKHDQYNVVAGSPYWMAPEVIRLESVTTASDIWSIGCLIVELLTGSPPYFDCQPYQALYRIVQDEHPPFPEAISDSLKSFLILCFEKEPASRPTAQELLKHEWIEKGPHRSASPIDSSGNGTSQDKVDKRKKVEDIFNRLLMHGSERNRRPPNPGRISTNRSAHHSDSEQTPSSDTKELHDIDPGGGAGGNVAGNSHSVSEITPEETKDPPITNINEVPSKNITDKRKADSSSVPQLTPLIPDRDREHIGTSHDKGGDGTSTQITSGASSPITRFPPSSLAREETELSVIFSDRISEYDSQTRRDGTNETWERGGDESTSPHTQTFSDQSRVCPPRGREHYDPSDIKRVLTSLHPHLPTKTITSALRDLTNLIRFNAEVKKYFINEDGLLLLLEILLLFDDLHVVELILMLSNMICGDSALILRDASAIGLAAQIFPFAQNKYPLIIRTEASRFLYSMCFASVKSMDHLIKCQGLKHLISLLEDGEDWKKLEFKETAVHCLLHIIEVQGAGMKTRILRMLCMADLPRKLISALWSINQNFEGSVKSQVSKIEDYPAEDLRPKSDSGYSLSEACIPGTPSEISSNPSHQSASTEESLQGEKIINQGNVLETFPSSDSHQKSEQSLSDRMIELLLLICNSPAEVHRHMCMSGVLQEFHKLLKLPSMELVHKVVICLKCLSSKPAVVESLEEVNTVCQLIPLLPQKDQSILEIKIQRECLIVIDNLCKCVAPWRDRAVKNGIVPYLCALSKSNSEIDSQSPPPEDDEMDVRRYSVPLLCKLFTVPSTHTRRIYEENNVISLFLELLQEEKWYKVILEALATWIEEDLKYVESRLIANTNVEQLISILRSYRYSYRSPDEISAVLNPLKRILDKSNRVSKMASLGGLVQVVLEMLKLVDAQTRLTLLRTLTRLYGVHPKPKEFIRNYLVEQYLDNLSDIISKEGSEEKVLIQKEITELTDAFQMNQIW